MPPIPPEQRSPYDGGYRSFDQFAFSIEEVSRVAALGRTALYAEIKSGRLIARKAGRCTIVLADDLRRWLESLPQVDRAA